MDTGEAVSFTEEVLARTALVYREAIEHAQRLYRSGLESKSDFDFELSMDETVTPTVPKRTPSWLWRGGRRGSR